MANKKTGNKKKSTSSKSPKKKQKLQQEDMSKKIDSVGEFNPDYRRVMVIASVIIIVFCLFYFITVYVTGRDSQKSSQTEDTQTFSYTNILAGRSFSMPEHEYLVLYYDSSDTELSADMNSLASEYRSRSDRLTLYSVDMSDSMNQSYVSEESNHEPASVSELAINGATLIHFKDDHVVEYFEGSDEVKGYFE